jgi:hypothetical protein
VLRTRVNLSATLRIVCAALASAVIAQAPEGRANAEPASPAAIVPVSVRTVVPARLEMGADLVAPPPRIEEWQKWRGLSFGTYLSPKSGFVTDDGGVDVVFHFHAGQMAERQMKESGANAVFVSCGYGIGSGAYSDALANPARFGRMLDELVRNLETQTGRKGLHVRHLALASWSAGFAAVGKILAVDRYYAMVDTVILNDSLHSQYKDPNPKTAAQGADRVDLKMIRNFVRFAKDATLGKKTMAITHSAIIPPDYASSTEATQALLTAIDIPTSAPSADDGDAARAGTWRSMKLSMRADAGNLHVRGFRGAGPRDHFEHLHLLGEVLRSWVVPRWKRDERLVYTLAGEQL